MSGKKYPLLYLFAVDQLPGREEVPTKRPVLYGISLECFTPRLRTKLQLSFCPATALQQGRVARSVCGAYFLGGFTPYPWNIEGVFTL